MSGFDKLTPPKDGTAIDVAPDGTLRVGDRPILPFIEGDGIGPDIWRASQLVFDAAVAKAYGGKRKIVWFEVFAGEKANTVYGPNTWLPEDTLKAIERYKVAIKGPLTTPVGGGIRSINVTIRQRLDLYACIRPVRYFTGVPSPMKEPEKVNIVLFRENTEDVYSGIEWKAGSAEAKKIIDFLNTQLGKSIRDDSGIGIKPSSPFAAKRLMRRAVQFAIDNQRESVTIVHKGNIMKFTEGAFKEWCYDLAREEFGAVTITEDDLWDKHDGKIPAGKIVIKDRIADAMFQNVLLRPDEFDVVIAMNLNGDYLSDALAAQVGGLGIAPGANIGDREAVFEATHGTAPKYANLDKVNPSSVILSGELMFRHMGWYEAADLIVSALEKTITAGTVTYDLARQREGTVELSCSAFGVAIANNM